MVDRDWRSGNPTYDDLAQERRNIDNFPLVSSLEQAISKIVLDFNAVLELELARLKPGEILCVHEIDYTVTFHVINSISDCEVSPRKCYTLPKISWEDRDPYNGLHDRNGHRILLSECEWICLKCRCKFDAAVDADKEFCKFSEEEVPCSEKFHSAITTTVQKDSTVKPLFKTTG